MHGCCQPAWVLWTTQPIVLPPHALHSRYLMLLSNGVCSKASLIYRCSPGAYGHM